MYFLGVDVGSISTDLVITDEKDCVKDTVYLRTQGRPVTALKEGLRKLGEKYDSRDIGAVGTTGSGRMLAKSLLGGDIVKNEITSHGVAAAKWDPSIRTVIEIGGQDSKIILLKDGMVTDFAMNTVCAAGTGSFLDRQAQRMGIDIDTLGDMALAADEPVEVAGRCAVFAESDLIHKQQTGVSVENLVGGMCRALVRNYLSNVAQGKTILEKVCFQGGVAANKGIKKAFETELGLELTVPVHHKVMGALGVTHMACEWYKRGRRKGIEKKTCFKGFETGLSDIHCNTFRCKDCSNNCEVTSMYINGMPVGCFSDRCGKYQRGDGILQISI